MRSELGGTQPIYDANNPAHRQALELFGAYVNCGFVLCSEQSGYAMVYVNELFPQYLGYTREEFLERYASYVDCIHPDDIPHVRETTVRALSTGDRYDLIYRVPRRDGSVLWIRENGQRVHAADGDRLLFCLLVDISKDMETRQEIERQSHTDALTGVLNRAAFVERAEKLFREPPDNSRRHAFLMLDIDRFKEINDTLGHAAGDQALEDVALTLKTLIRTGDILGRLGGDEFMLCLKGIPADTSIEGRLEQFLSRLHRALPSGVTLSCSLGVAFYPTDGKTFDTLYRAADMALYEAKRAGRGCFCIYRPEMADEKGIRHTTPIDR